jgi:hypothetical protein
MEGVPFNRLLSTWECLLAKPPFPQESSREAAWAALDFFVSGLRGLASWGFDDGDRAQGYFEEVVEEGWPATDPDSGKMIFKPTGRVIGRMIHFDTSMPRDTPWEDVRLDHLDLAINLYTGDVAQERLRTPVHQRIETRRTHIFKAAPIALKLLPGIACLFLRKSRRHLPALFARMHLG